MFCRCIHSWGLVYGRHYIAKSFRDDVDVLGLLLLLVSPLVYRHFTLSMINFAVTECQKYDPFEESMVTLHPLFQICPSS